MKRVLALLLAVLLVVPTMGALSFADLYQPVIGVDSEQPIQKISSKDGDKVSLSIPIVNTSALVANSVKVTLSGDLPFRSYSTDLTEYVGVIGAYDSATANLDLILKPDAQSKYYEIDVQFDYRNTNGQDFTSTDKMIVQVENDEVAPTLGVVSYRSVNDTIVPGVEDGIVMHIQNAGTINAKDVKVTLSGFSNEGLVLDRDVDTKTSNTIIAGQTDIFSFRIKAGVDAVGKTVPITAKIEYIDDYGNPYSKESVMYFEVEGIDISGADVAVTNLSYPKKLKENQDFKVAFTVKNNGTIDLKDVEISVDYPQDFVATEPSKKVIKELKAGESIDFKTALRTKSELSTQNYDGWVTVNYHVKGDKSEDGGKIQEYMGFFITDQTAGSKPKLIIDNYDYGGEYVYAGEPYQLNLHIKNTSTSESTRNIKVTLTSEDSVFTPVDSSSSFFINNIGPGEVYDHTIDLKTKIDAAVKIYSLTVKMEYEDGQGNAYDENKNPYAEEENLSIAVAQPVRLETGDLVIPSDVSVGEPFYIEQEFYNMGKSTMYNMMVKAEGVESNESNYFVGNFEAGSSDYYSAQCYASEEGTVEGKLIFSFEDALGNVTTKEQPFSFTATAGMTSDFSNDGFGNGGDVAFDDPNMMMEPDEQGLPVKTILIVLAVIVIILVIVFMMRRRKKKRLKELEDLDE